MAQPRSRISATRIATWTAPLIALGGVTFLASRRLGRPATPRHGAVTEWIDAAPEAIFDLVSDVTRTGEFSPATVEAEWLDGATGPAVGARFRGHVDREFKGVDYWTACRIIACEPGHEFAFVMGFGDRDINTWRYQFTPDLVHGGTTVTESFEVSDWIGLKIFWKLVGWHQGPLNMRGMRTTLANLKKVAENRA